MAENTVSITITGDSTAAVNALKKVAGGLDDVNNSAKTSSSFVDNLKKNWLALTAATAGAVMGIRKVVNLAAEQQKNQYLLAAAMKQTGIYTAEAYKHNLDYASSLQKITAFGDEEILSVQKSLTMFGAQGEMLDELTRATLDLASAKGMDLKQAGDLVARSIGTETNALARQGVVMEGAAGSTQRMQSAVENITKLFGGSAQAYAQTFSGQVKQMQEALSEVGEEIGMIIIPLLVPFIKWLKEAAVWFASLPQPVKTAAVALVGLAIAIKAIGVASAFLNFNPIIAAITALAAVVMLAGGAMKKMQDESRSSAGALRDLGFVERAIATQKEYLVKLEFQRQQASDAATQTAISNAMLETENELKTLEIKRDAQLKEVERRKQIEQEEGKASIDLQKDMAKQKKLITDQFAKSTKDSAKDVLTYSQMIENEILQNKIRMREEGMRALIDSASSEKATIGSVAAAIIESLAKALAESMTVRAIAAVATGNFIAAAGYTSAAIAIKAAGARAGKAIRGDVSKMANGGIIDEPVLATGTRTGNQYLMGEAGRESYTVITPENKSQAGGGININNLTIYAQDVNDFKKQLGDIYRQSGSRAMRR